jgi:hypothetical protein
MCKMCSAPRRRYLIRDVKTGLLVCEECGLAFHNLEGTERREPRHISELNPAWPRFRSFEDLIARIIRHGQITLPPCKAVNDVPSRLLSYAVDMLGTPGPEENEKKH